MNTIIRISCTAKVLRYSTNIQLVTLKSGVKTFGVDLCKNNTNQSLKRNKGSKQVLIRHMSMQSNCLVRNKGFKGKSLDTLNNSEALLELTTYNGASTIPREFTVRAQ